MRCIATVAALLVSIGSAFAESPPADFAGIKWGSSIAEGQQAMEQKMAVPEKSFSTADKAVFSGGTFANGSVKFWDLFYTAGQFYRGRIKFHSDQPPAERLKTLKRLLTEKYGPSSERSAKTVEGNTMAHPETFWVVESPLDHKKIVIECYLLEGLCILQYTDENIRAKAAGAGKADL